MWLWGTFLVVISCKRLPMNNYQGNVFLRQCLYWLILLSSIIPIFQAIIIISLIMTNTMTCAMKREVWTWYLPSHLVPAKILCSRCEPCTNINETDDNRLKCVCVSNVTFPQSAYCHPCYDHYSFHHYSQLIKRFTLENY